MPAGARIVDPVTKFPNIKAVGAKRRWTGPSEGFFMHMHLGRAAADGKGRRPNPVRVMRYCIVRFACYTAPHPAYLRSFAGVSFEETNMSDKNPPASGFQYSLTNLKPAEPVQKVTLTFPDGAKREYPKSTTGLEIAKGISPSLAKRTVAMALDGALADLNDAIENDARIELISRDDPRALELIRHDAAHVLAEAVQALWPGTQVTIGPVIENGFYYDFFRNEPFTPEDFAAIEKKMREIIAR